jgi:hypothetical protein
MVDDKPPVKVGPGASILFTGRGLSFDSEHRNHTYEADCGLLAGRA